MIRFSCPHCRKSLKAEVGSTGKRTRCPKCRSLIQVPRTQGELVPLEHPVDLPAARLEAVRESAVQLPAEMPHDQLPALADAEGASCEQPSKAGPLLASLCI